MKTLLQITLAIALLPALLAGCNVSSFKPTPDQEKIAQGYIDNLRHHQFDPIEAAADPSIRSPSLHDDLVRMWGLIPEGEPSGAKLVGYQKSTMPSAEMVNLTYEYTYPGQWLAMNAAVLTQGQGGVRTLVGLSVMPLQASLEQQHEFDLAGKTPFAYMILALAIALPLFTLYALVVCIRTKFRGRKWPWVIFVMFGFGTLSLNWFSGAVSLQLVSFSMFSAAVVASSQYSPWTLSIAIPLGAIVFLARRRKLMARPAPLADSAALQQT